MSIIQSLKRLLDPIQHRQQAENVRRQREALPGDEQPGPPRRSRSCSSAASANIRAKASSALAAWRRPCNRKNSHADSTGDSLRQRGDALEVRALITRL